MQATNIRCVDGKYKYFFELPFSYGYVMMLDMAQVVIDYYFSRSIQSFRVSRLSGSQEKEFKYLLRIYNNRIDKCKLIHKEQGVIYLEGKSTNLEDEIEIVWFNQTNIIGVAGNYGDDNHRTKVEQMLDIIISPYV